MISERRTAVIVKCTLRAHPLHLTVAFFKRAAAVIVEEYQFSRYSNDKSRKIVSASAHAQQTLELRLSRTDCRARHFRDDVSVKKKNVFARGLRSVRFFSPLSAYAHGRGVRIETKRNRVIRKRTDG